MTFTASDVLLKAASRIEEEGMWCQQYWFQGQLDEVYAQAARIREIDPGLQIPLIVAAQLADRGLRLPECAVGAISSASIELDVDSNTWKDAIRRFWLANDRIAEEFNDTPGRTAHEVAEAMRQAAL